MNLARGVQTLAVVLVLGLAGCGDGVHRGRVIDQDTGEPVAGAIVVGRYMGSIAWGGSSCNRAESSVSDADGWFELPVDPKDGEPLMEAYKYGYDRGNRNRIAFLSNPWTREWRVQVQKWNEGNTHAEFVEVAPEVYRFESTALAASGQNANAFVRITRDRDWRIKQLRAFQIYCSGGAQTTAGLVPFIQGILAEQQNLGEEANVLIQTEEALRLANHRGKHG